jgi:hypothetical protein
MCSAGIMGQSSSRGSYSNRAQMTCYIQYMEVKECSCQEEKMECRSQVTHMRHPENVPDYEILVPEVCIPLGPNRQAIHQRVLVGEISTE